MNARPSRRELLAGTGATIASFTAGCVDFGTGVEPKFRLKSHRIDDVVLGPSSRPFLIDPLEIQSKHSIELSDEYKREKVGKLVETGTISTRAWELSYRSRWGRTRRDRRTCFVHDGGYYRVWVESRAEVERDRWVFYFDWEDQDPSNGDETITLSTNPLTGHDKEVIEAAYDTVPTPGRRDVSYERTLESYAIVFHDELDPETSELVPDPPFDYLEHDGEYFRAVTERGPVRRPEQTFSVERVADSFDEYRQYAMEHYPDVRFDAVSLSEDATEVLETAVSFDEGNAYEEKPPLSSGLEEVLDHLGIAEHLEPHESYDDVTWFNNALAEFRNRWYDLDLFIYPEDHEH